MTRCVGAVSGYEWRQVVLPVPVDEKRVRAFLSAVATLPGRPHVCFELVGDGGLVLWRLGSEPWATRDIHALLVAHLPGVRLLVPNQLPAGSSLDEGAVARLSLSLDEAALSAPSVAATVTLTHSRWQMVRTDVGEQVSRTILTALSRVASGEQVRLQVVCGARLTPTRPASLARHAAGRVVERNWEEHGFAVALRVAAHASTVQRARALVRAVVAGLRAVETPPVRVRAWKARPGSVAVARSPWLMPNYLRVSELSGLLVWPLVEGLPGVPSVHPVSLPPVGTYARTGRVLGISVTTPAHQVRLSDRDALRHMHVLGPTGVGKSTLLAQMALHDMTHGKRVVVIDPKGSLVDDIARRVPEDLLARTVIIDAADAAPVGINPLSAPPYPDLAADGIVSIFQSLFADSWGPRTHDILHASVLTLARRGDASLVMIPLLLTNPGFRRSVTGRLAAADPLGLGAFWAWYEALSDAERHHAISPLMNKLRPVLLRPQLRAVFGQRRPRFDMRHLFNCGSQEESGASSHSEAQAPRVVLVSLAKGAIGADAAKLFGSIVVAQVWQAALERAARTDSRPAVMMHIDEVQDYLRLPTDLGDALAQGRGLGLGLTLSHQQMGQLSGQLRAAIMANARSRVAFSLAKDDARLIAAESRGLLSAEDYQQLPAFHAYASLLVDGENAPPLSLATLPLGEPLRSNQAAREASRRRFGQEADDVERDLAALAGLTPSHAPDITTIGRVRRPSAGKDGDLT